MIKKIVIEIGGKEIELTNVEAIQLHNELDRLFGHKVDPYPVVYPANPWAVPSIWEPYTIPPSVTWVSDTYTTSDGETTWISKQ